MLSDIVYGSFEHPRTYEATLTVLCGEEWVLHPRKSFQLVDGVMAILGADNAANMRQEVLECIRHARIFDEIETRITAKGQELQATDAGKRTCEELREYHEYHDRLEAEGGEHFDR